MAILLIQDQADAGDKLAFALESTFGGEIYQAASPADAFKLIQTPPGSPVTLVIFDDRGVVGIELDALQGLNPALGCVLCVDSSAASGSLRIKWDILAVVDRAALVENLLETLKKLSEEGRIELGYHEEDFCKIKTTLLLSVCPLKSDVYIRLSERKFVKLFHEGDSFEATDMEKYTVKKGVEYLYIRKSAVDEFVHKYNADLSKVVRKARNMSVQDIGRLHENVYETTAELGRRVGFTPEVQQMAKAHMQMTIASMDKSMRLGNVLDRIKSYGGQYIGAHSGIVGYMACAIASKMEWASESTFQKLTLAAFLHDVTLTNHELAACNSIGEAQSKGFSDKELAQFRAHPAKGAEIARQFQEVPPDVDVIILQHHELPDGTGFPRGIGYSYIAPLAMVFIVAHEMAQFFLKNDSELRRDDFLALAREKFKSSQFRKVLDAIEKL